MKLKKGIVGIFIVSLLSFIAVSCASYRPPYHHYKPKKPSGCDCSHWSYNDLPYNIVFHASQTEFTGRS
jgi:hypothetical protein